MAEPALSLHAPTVMFITALVVAFSGGLMMFAKGPRRDAGAIVVWGAAMLLAALGFVLTGVGQGAAWLWDGVGTAMFLGATSVSWAAARVFAERPPRPWLTCAGPVLWLATLPVLSAYPDEACHWLAGACFVGAGYVLATAGELWRTRSEELPSRNAALILLLGHAAVYVARGADALAGTPPAGWSGTIRIALLLEGLLHTIGMAFILLAMVKERVELRTSQQLRALALQDGLTGIGNRRHFDEQLAKEVRRARRVRSQVALLMIDVDHFKMFNDSFGHQQGDACLRDVAGAISGVATRPGDLVARYGGEEFAVLLPDTDLAGATALGEAARCAVAALWRQHCTPEGTVTISVGAAVLRPGRDGDAGAALVHAADAALYEAKAGGRNRVCGAGPVAVAA